jgi:hypothetical protein
LAYDIRDTRMSLRTEVGVCAGLPVIVTIRGNREWSFGKISGICTKSECLDGGDLGRRHDYGERIRTTLEM